MKPQATVLDADLFGKMDGINRPRETAISGGTTQGVTP